MASNLTQQNDYNLRMVNNLNDVNNVINKGVGVNQMMNVPMNFPFVGQINQMQNLQNMQRNNMGTVPQNMNNNNINNINNINRTNY